MRIKDDRHGTEHHVETPDLWGADQTGMIQTPLTPASAILSQEAVRAYLSYGTPRWLSVDIKAGVLSSEERVFHSPQRSIKKQLAHKSPPPRPQGTHKGGATNPEVEAAEEGGILRALPLNVDVELGEVPMVHFRECLRKASLTREQMWALEQNTELTYCTYTLQRLSEQIQTIILALSNHRRESARVLHKASVSYVLLFERLVAEFVRLARSQSEEVHTIFRSQAAEAESLRRRLGELEAQVSVAELEQMQHHSLNALYKTAKAQLQIANARIAELEESEAAHVRQSAEAREVLRDTEKKRAALEKELRHKETQVRVELEGQIASMDQRMQDLTNETTRQLVEADIKRKRMEEEAKWRADMNRKFRCRGTQTKVDPDGSWDVQDGWPMSISTRAWARIMWRIGARFAACPACKGVKPYLKQALEEQRLQKLANMPSEFKPSRRRAFNNTAMPRSLSVDGWFVPDAIVQFVSHLPKTAEAAATRPLTWLYSECWNLLHDKMAADDEDFHSGDPFIGLSDFVMQEYLRKAPSRMEAQVAVFELVRSLRVWRNQCPLMHLFARFLGLMDGGVGEREEHGLNSTSTNWESGVHYKASSSSLDSTFLVVYLYLRRNILASPHIFVPPTGLRRMLPASTRFSHLAQLPPWAVLTDECNIWLPLECVYHVVRSILYFIGPKQLKSLTAWIEIKSIIYKPLTGEVQGPEGNKVTVRRAMRRALRRTPVSPAAPPSNPSHSLSPVRPSSASSDGSDNSLDTPREDSSPSSSLPPPSPILVPGFEASTGALDEGVVLLSIDHILEFTMDALADRGAAMEDQIKAYFHLADANHDGSVSFPEFSAVMHNIDPSLSTHNLSKVFREVYKESHTFAMTKEAFASVLRRFGLVSLLDLGKAQAFLNNGGVLPPSPSNSFQSSHNAGEGTLRRRHGPIDRSATNAPLPPHPNSAMSQTGTLGGSNPRPPATSTTSTASSSSRRPSLSSQPPSTPQQVQAQQPGGSMGQPHQTVRSIATTTAALSRAVGGIQRVMRKVLTSPANHLRMHAQAMQSMQSMQQALSPPSPVAVPGAKAQELGSGNGSNGHRNAPVQGSVGGSNGPFTGSFNSPPMRDTGGSATKAGPIGPLGGGGNRASPSGAKMGMGPSVGLGSTPPSPQSPSSVSSASSVLVGGMGEGQRTEMRMGNGGIGLPLPSPRRTSASVGLSAGKGASGSGGGGNGSRRGNANLALPLPSSRQSTGGANGGGPPSGSEFSPRPALPPHQQEAGAGRSKAPRNNIMESQSAVQRRVAGLPRESSHFASFVATGVGGEDTPPPIQIVYRTHSGLLPFSSSSPRRLIAESNGNGPVEAQRSARPVVALEEEEDKALAALIDENVEDEEEDEGGDMMGETAR